MGFYVGRGYCLIQQMVEIEPPDEIFANEQALRIDYIPDELPEREHELDQLKSAFRPVKNGTAPHNTFIYGKSGQGKTAATYVIVEAYERYFEKYDVDEELTIVHVPCEDATSSYQVVGEAIVQLKPEVTERPNGYSLGDLNRMMFNAIDEIGGIVVLILDEIDSIGTDDSIFYQISRAEANGRIENSKVAVMGISNDFRFREKLSPKAKDTLCKREIHFEPYTSGKLETILRQREEIAFNDGVLEGAVIPLCSAFAAQEHGSARQAIQYLYRAGELAADNGETSVGEHHVREAREQIDKERMVEDLLSMTVQDKMALAGLLRLQNREETPARTKDIHREYTKVAEMLGADALSKRRMYDHLQAMATHGFANAKEKNTGLQNGRFATFDLEMSPEQVMDAFREDDRLGEVTQTGALFQ